MVQPRRHQGGTFSMTVAKIVERLVVEWDVCAWDICAPIDTVLPLGANLKRIL